jgi:catechol 2,3-dioxygenase-like lactoylglutathione lyase family enzyme
MLGNAPVVAVVPTVDLDRGREFYEGTLGFEEAGLSSPGGVVYACGVGTRLLVYESDMAGTNRATAVAWEVGDLDGEVSALRSKGIAFERYDLPGVERDGDIHRFGSLRGAWFKDPDGNILNIVSQS